MLGFCLCRCVFAGVFFIAAHSAAAFIKRFRHPYMCVRKEYTQKDTQSTPAILLDRRQHVDIMHNDKADSRRSKSVDLLLYFMWHYLGALLVRLHGTSRQIAPELCMPDAGITMIQFWFVWMYAFSLLRTACLLARSTTCRSGTRSRTLRVDVSDTPPSLLPIPFEVDSLSHSS